MRNNLGKIIFTIKKSYKGYNKQYLKDWIYLHILIYINYLLI